MLTNCSQSFWLSLGFGDLAPRPWHEVRRWPLISFSRITHTPWGLGSGRVEWSGAGLHCFSTGMRMWLVKRACRARVLLWLEIGGWVRIASDGVKVKASVLNVRVNAEYGGPACVESTAILLVPILAACI